MKIFLAALILLLASLTSAAAQNTKPTTPVEPADQRAAASAASPIQDHINPAKEANIRHLLDVAGTKAIMAQMMKSMTGDIRPILTNSLPAGDYREKLVDLFIAKFQSKVNLEHLIDLAVVAYNNHFTDDEIKGLINFYQTPLGQKTVSVLPQLMLDLTQAGREWGESMGRECMQEVLTEHPELVEAMKAAKSSSQAQ